MFSIARANTPSNARRSAAAVLVALLALLPDGGFAAAAGPFRPFVGSWQGTGRISMSSGQQESITCRATYDGGEDDRTLAQALVCASDSYRLDIRSNAVANGGVLQGQWQETTRNVQGELSGQIGRGDFEGSVSGPGFTAQVSIRASGSRQMVHIQPSAGDIQSVDIVLRRRR